MENGAELKTRSGSVALSGVVGFMALIVVTTAVQDMVSSIFRPREIVVVEKQGIFKRKKRITF